MLDSKLKELLETLHQQTEQGKIDWKETSDSDTFVVVLKGFSVSVMTSNMGIGGLTLRDAQGKQIEDSIIFDSEPEWQKLKELHTLARRQVRKVDEAVDEVLKQLKIA